MQKTSSTEFVLENKKIHNSNSFEATSEEKNLYKKIFGFLDKENKGFLVKNDLIHIIKENGLLNH